MATIIKQTSNLTGLLLPKNPKHTLQSCYKRILTVLQKMPENAAYKKHTENIVNQRLSIVNSTDDIKVIEEKIACGELTEIIIQAQNELSLAESLLFSRPWETLIHSPPENQWQWPAN